MNEISCEVIQDLIKGCADGTASRATVKLVLEHIKMCDECRAKYEALRSGKKARVRKWFFVLHEEPLSQRRCAICDGASLRSPR